jgi:hypothetical protein
MVRRTIESGNGVTSRTMLARRHMLAGTGNELAAQTPEQFAATVRAESSAGVRS